MQGIHEEYILRCAKLHCHTLPVEPWTAASILTVDWVYKFHSFDKKINSVSRCFTNKESGACVFTMEQGMESLEGFEAHASEISPLEVRCPKRKLSGTRFPRVHADFVREIFLGLWSGQNTGVLNHQMMKVKSKEIVTGSTCRNLQHGFRKIFSTLTTLLELVH